MPRPTPTGIKHEVLALADETLRQSAIAGRVGLIGATVKRILQRHGGATGLWCRASPMGLLGRPHLVQTVLC